MKRIFPVLLFLMSCLMVNGQSNTPGYLGKRTFITIQYLPSFGLSGSGHNRSYRKGLDGAGGGNGGFYVAHSVSGAFNYIISKRFSMGLGVRQGWFGMETNHPFAPFERVKAFSGGLHFDLYPFRKRGTIAPLGPYTRFKALWAYGRSFITQRVVDSDIPETGPLDSKVMMPFFVLEFGNNLVIGDFMTLSPGFSFSVGYPTFVLTGAPSTAEQEDIWIRMQNGWGINLFLEMGFML